MDKLLALAIVLALGLASRLLPVVDDDAAPPTPPALRVSAGLPAGGTPAPAPPARPRQGGAPAALDAATAGSEQDALAAR